MPELESLSTSSMIREYPASEPDMPDPDLGQAISEPDPPDRNLRTLFARAGTNFSSSSWNRTRSVHVLTVTRLFL
ncbi:hypothetical protein PCASD_21347 [Puccinia coronata f. sp. avenae]|nr:hypothetical protein PCASD_21347 [Puccinia coronata f. sp. avenae]